MNESDSLHIFSSTLDEMLLVWKILLIWEYARSRRYVVPNNLVLAMLSDPDGIHLFLPFRPNVIAYCRSEGIGFHFLNLTGLYHFTLSHYGSHCFLPTLKPNLTTSAPRLDTGGWLNLTRPASHRLYSRHRTAAPLPIFYILKLLIV